MCLCNHFKQKDFRQKFEVTGNAESPHGLKINCVYSQPVDKTNKHAFPMSKVLAGTPERHVNAQRDTRSTALLSSFFFSFFKRSDKTCTVATASVGQLRAALRIDKEFGRGCSRMPPVACKSARYKRYVLRS